LETHHKRICWAGDDRRQDGAIVGAIAGSIIESPAWKSRIAIVMNKGSKAGTGIKFKAGFRPLAFQAGRVQEITEE
jgi:hypothetical protein